MAGGIGSRFWPLSKTAKPKQFLDILGTGRSFLQDTYDRFAGICPVENFLVVTSLEYKDLVLEQLPDLNPSQVLAEPMRKNTAPCIAFANYRIASMNPQANIVVTPADHLILKVDDFKKKIKLGLDFVSKNKALLTLGIKPNRPETGYGYIQINSDEKSGKGIHKVKTFTEKPDKKLAQIFFESGEFFWNSGIFLWNLQTIQEAFAEHLEEVDSLFSEGSALFGTDKEDEFVQGVYSECKSISIDYGIMEKASNVYVLSSDFGWSDLGTWGSLHEHSAKDEKSNVTSGCDVLLYQTKDCIVKTENQKLVVVWGLDGFIVVESGGTLLICKKDEEQQIRQIVNDVKMKRGDTFI